MKPTKIAELNITVATLYQQGRYKEAIEPASLSIDLTRQILGEKNKIFATSLNTLGLLYYSVGRYVEAEPLYKRAIKIYPEVESEQHPNFATFVNNLAALYKAMGNYAAAEPLYKQAMEIRRRVVGEKHLDFAASLDNLAGLYEAIGNYPAAESLCKQAIEIYRVLVGEQHPDFAISLNNLAGLYETMGKYAKAEPLHKQALEIDRMIVGDRHPSFASGLNNLAILYKSMGNYVAAELLYKQAIEIYRAVNKQHPNYAASLDNLAVLYTEMGKDRYVAAELLCKQALEIRRAVLGRRHPDFATSLNNLAGLYEAMGDYPAAEPLYKRAMKIRRAIFGKQHPNFATSLSNLAGLYLFRGKYAKAEPLCKEALEIRHAVFGEQHPGFAGSLNGLARLLAATGRVTEALAIMEQALAIENRMLGQVFSISSESQRSAYHTIVRYSLDRFLSLLSPNLSYSPEAVRSALSVVLQRKAVEAEALATQRDAVLGGKYPEVAPKLREITTLRAQIAQKTLSGPGKEGLQTHQQLLSEWNAQKEKLEAEVARQVPEMNLEQKLRSIDHQVVAMAMPEGATLVEFVRFDVFDFKAVPVRSEKQWKPARYLAFVMAAGEPDNIEMIDLGEAEPIDQMIATFREIITGEEENRRKRGINASMSSGGFLQQAVTKIFSRKRGLGAAPTSVPRVTSKDVGLQLSDAIFTPLLQAIGNRKRLMISPDGDLTRLPFEVLPMDDGRRLIDEYRISYLGAGRDVARFGFKSNRQPSRSLVAADPNFDFGAKALHTESAIGAGRRSRDFKRDSVKAFDRLPGTRLEGENIAAMLDAELWLEGKALDARLKSCKSPRILHLATHGFFLADQKRDPNEDRLGFGTMSFSESGMERLTSARFENPLLRSGLALAGANTWLKKGELMEEAEDGLLTAEDVTGLDLLDTELVVLSACETGLGEVRVGEGVFGLRRAFILAGAKTLVMSLWKVPDLATGILMERFYDNLCNRHFGRSESLRDAQFYTRDATVGQIRSRWLNDETIERLAAGDEKTQEYLEWLERQPDDYCPFVHPLYWGAFICQGYDGALTD